MRPPVRIALVGLGDIAIRAHLPALEREPRVELAALVVDLLLEEGIQNHRSRAGIF